MKRLMQAVFGVGCLTLGADAGGAGVVSGPDSESGTFIDAQAECVPIVLGTNRPCALNLSNGWYVASGLLYVDRFNVLGDDVHLVLADGCELMAVTRTDRKPCDKSVYI